MKIHFKPQMSQINADKNIAENRSSVMFSSLNHLRTSESSAVDLLQSEGEK
jgi:hypothetical protein